VLGDFHLHSRHSDGRLDPVALVDLVADAGVQIAALTDHDTTGGHADAARRARERSIHFVPGIEMTAYAHGRVIHVLGLGVDGASDRLRAANQIACETWDENQRRWVESLEHDGANVGFERDFHDHPVRLPVLIERLCLRGVDEGDPVRVHARFRAFFAALPPGAYERLPSPAAAATTIRHAGGVALLAHPDGLREAGLLEALLGGCDGLEAMYLPYSEAQRAALRAIADERGKLYSCGTDYHGYFTTQYRALRWDAPPQLLARLGIS
jgi:3',5'-nucleoside bisphosphate phosphatase